MANPLKDGQDVTSGTGESSSNKGGPMIERPYGAQQRAIQDANHAQDQAAKAAGEAAFRKAAARPPQKQISNAVTGADWGGGRITFTKRGK